MSRRDVIRHLQDLGFDEREAEIYVLLLQNGPSRAGQVANLTEASRGKVYAALKELSQRGVVHRTVGTPAIYRATEPERLFEIAVQDLERRRSYVETMRDELLETMETISTSSPALTPPEWELLESRGAILESLNTALSSAESSIHTASSHSLCGLSLRPVVEAWGTLGEKARSGVDVRVLSDMGPKVRERIDESVDGGSIEFRRLEVEPTIHFVLVDDAVVYNWMVCSGQGGLGSIDDIVVRTDAHGLLDACRLLFRALWRNASPPEVNVAGIGAQADVVEGR